MFKEHNKVSRVTLPHTRAVRGHGKAPQHGTLSNTSVRTDACRQTETREQRIGNTASTRSGSRSRPNKKQGDRAHTSRASVVRIASVTTHATQTHSLRSITIHRASERRRGGYMEAAIATMRTKDCGESRPEATRTAPSPRPRHRPATE